MSYNGSGTFNINTAGQPVVTGTVISSTAFNALTADLGTGLSTAITKDGQTVATALIPFAAGMSSTTGAFSSTLAAGNTTITGTLSATGIITASEDVKLQPTKKLYLDGGGDTYIVEGSANSIDAYALGTKMLSLVSGGAAVTGILTATSNFGVAATKRLYLDGVGVNGNTYIVEVSADQIALVAGGTTSMNIYSSGVGLVGNSEVEGIWQPGTDNSYTLGTAAKRWTTVYAVTGTINTSDERDKIKEETPVPGLAFVNAVHPFMGKWKLGGNIVTKDADGEKVVTPRAGVRTHAFFSAQEVKAQMDAIGVDFGAYVYMPEDDKHGMRPDQLIPVLWKAVQELTAKVAALEAK